MCRSCSEYRPSANSGYSVSLDDAVDAFKEKVNNKRGKKVIYIRFYMHLRSRMPGAGTTEASKMSLMISTPSTSTRDVSELRREEEMNT